MVFGVVFGLLFVFASSGKTQEIKGKLGIYVWGELAKSADPLFAAIEDVKSMGADQVVRTSISPYWDPRVATAGESQFLPLYQKMHRADYWEFFNSFPVVMITAYDAASYPTRYRLAEENAGRQLMLREVSREFQLFAYNLACEIPNGTFIISNWEAENDVTVATEEAWNRYLEYIQARLNGVIAGREEAESSGCSGRVYNAFEFVDIKALGGEWDQQTSKFSGTTFAPRFRGLDFLSYSSWNSIGYMHPPDYVRASFTEAIRNIRSFAREHGITDKLIIGEFGELWDLYPNSENSRLETIVETSLAEGVEYLFNWVAYDQPGNGVMVGDKWYDQSHFGKLYQNRELTLQGESFRNLLKQ